MTSDNGSAAGKSSKNGPSVHGAGVTPYGMFVLAEEYRRAGDIVYKHTGGRGPSGNPIRLLYYQALEGYLRAFLRLHGKEPEEIRAYMHNFGKMCEDCEAAGLVLRRKTVDFLQETTKDRDYVRVRYEFGLSVPDERTGPGKPGKELTRLIAAANEVQEKIKGALKSAEIMRSGR